MKTLANLGIATLPRSGVWGADDCGEPNSLATVSSQRQEKLPQQFSEPTSDFLVWGRSPCAVASRMTKRGYPRQREERIALRRDSSRSGIFRQEKICDEGGSLGFRGAPQAQRGEGVKLGIQPKAVTKPARQRTAGAKPFFIASALFHKYQKIAIFGYQMNRLSLLFTYVYLLLTLVFIGGSNAK